jgi:hypothetical protein
MFSSQADCKFEMSNCCPGEERFGLLRIDCDLLPLLAERFEVFVKLFFCITGTRGVLRSSGWSILAMRS